MGENLFLELTIIVAMTVFCSWLAKILRQPIIIGYIMAAVILGPQLLNVVQAHDAVATFSEIGVAFLLFMVGLGLNVSVARQVGKISVITGVGQVLFTALLGFFIGLGLGFDTLTALYVAVALTFSSTIVIMKLLSDQKALETLYGKISIGFLIVQDIIAMLILMFVSASATATSLKALIVESLFMGMLLIGGFMLIGAYVLPPIVRKMASSDDLLFLFCIGWCLSLASLFSWLGFSIEIGALLAGITLSMSPYRHEISVRIKPLRDFFLILFFVFLGTQMSFADLEGHLLAIALFSLFILIGNPLIVMMLMGAMGYTKRTGLMAGFTVAQISEFSLILIALGVKLGHLSPNILSMTTVIGLITIVISTYYITYNKSIYNKIKAHLDIFERQGHKVDRLHYTSGEAHDVLLIGFNHIGSRVTEVLHNMKKKVVVLDHDPDVIMRLTRDKIDCVYGDAEDTEIFTQINLSALDMVICTTKDFDINTSIISLMKSVKPTCVIIAVSESVEDAISLYDRGATYVIMPHLLGGAHTSMLIEEYQNDIGKFLEKGLAHMEELKKKPRPGI